MDEFIDAYSDDQIYLEMIERLVNNDPVESVVPDSIKYSSFCRLWIVMMVGSIEMMIKKWAKPEWLMADIAAYLEKGTNEEKIDGLFKAIEMRGLQPDRDCFEVFWPANSLGMLMFMESGMKINANMLSLKIFLLRL